MKTHIISIGNSRGIRIPKAILEQCRIEKDVELELENDKIILKPSGKRQNLDAGLPENEIAAG